MAITLIRKCFRFFTGVAKYMCHCQNLLLKFVEGHVICQVCTDTLSGFIFILKHIFIQLKSIMFNFAQNSTLTAEMSFNRFCWFNICYRLWDGKKCPHLSWKCPHDRFLCVTVFITSAFHPNIIDKIAKEVLKSFFFAGPPFNQWAFLPSLVGWFLYGTLLVYPTV